MDKPTIEAEILKRDLLMVSEPTLDCCIVGAGPAGLMLGLLMARAGLQVTVLERFANFDRDFRGDTVHASTLEVLDQLGLAEKVLALPHSKLRKLGVQTPEKSIEIVSFDGLPTKFPYVAIMPQAQFLEFLCAEAECYPNFRCIRGASAQALLEDDGPDAAVTGVSYRCNEETVELKAKLTVATDGRFSRLRKLSGLKAKKLAPPMDVCWMRLPRLPGDGFDSGGFFVGGGRMLVCLPRPDSWQLGYVLAKGSYQELQEQGLPALRESLLELAEWLGTRVELLQAWDTVHLLNIQSDCLERWYKPGLLMLGDSAHVMSPVGGVGINMAIADAVEAANVLANPQDPALAKEAVGTALLAEVQRRRMLATRIIQRFQVTVQDQMVKRALREEPFDLPWFAKLVLAVPALSRIPRRVLALGFPQARLEIHSKG